jgi:hypothetical protein
LSGGNTDTLSLPLTIHGSRFQIRSALQVSAST